MYDQIFAFSNHPTIEKSSQIGHNKKSLILTFAYFLKAIAKD